MRNDLEQVRCRSGPRNLNLDLNRVPEAFEVFVYHLKVPGHDPMEVHMPIEWVGIGSNDEIVFSAEAQRFTEESRELVLRY
jgi:hypothetical protein